MKSATSYRILIVCSLLALVATGCAKAKPARMTGFIPPQKLSEPEEAVRTRRSCQNQEKLWQLRVPGHPSLRPAPA